MNNLSDLITESRNQKTMNIDDLSAGEILTIINNEDISVAMKVQEVIPEITETVEAVSYALSNGGKLYYIGAGTSGRIGILDAVECPPTFSTPPNLVQAIIAGGKHAIEKAVEGAEDDEQRGVDDLKARNVTAKDVVIGIAASGRTPYVIGALKYAQDIGATTVSLSSNRNALISQHADIKIEVITGAEVITGSTRMKAATAHKLILNMITTTAMIKIGKVYENLMVDVKISNLKLKKRAENILSTITGITSEEAEIALKNANFEVKPAIIMVKKGVNLTEAKSLLNQANGYVRKALELVE